MARPLVAMVMCCLVGVAHPEILNPLQKAQIGRMAKYIMGCGNIPGLSLSIVRGPESWTLPLGVTDVTSREPVTDVTKFAIGSLTKAFTSTLLVQLLQESPNNFTIDTPLKDILQKDDLFPDDLRSNEATVKDILSHRMGLARADLSIFGGYPDTFSLEDMAKSLSCLPVQTPFRDGYIYSNFMYSLAGHVIETLANQSYGDVIKSKLLGPLRMTSTTTEYNTSDPYDGMAQPYLLLNGQLSPSHHSMFRHLKPFMPAFGLSSNARDMTRWLQVQLGRGVLPSGERILKEGVVDTTHQPITPNIINNLRPRFPQPDLTFAYGLGWHQAVYKGFRRVWHAGTLFGYTSLIWMFPDLNMGLFVVVNGPGKAPDTKNRISALFYYITDMLFGDQPWIDQSTACSYPFPARFTQVQPIINSDSNNNVKSTSNTTCIPKSVDLEKYAGVYYNKLFGNVTVVALPVYERNSKCQRSQIQLEIVVGQHFKGKLKYTSFDSFQMEPTGIFEFSAHPSENELSTMPIQFATFDADGVPYTLKAVWQVSEVIDFGRGRDDNVCVPRASLNSAEVPRISILTIIGVFYILVYNEEVAL